MTHQLTFGRWTMGVSDVCFKPRIDTYECARRAKEAGFSHLDLHSYWDDGDESRLALPIGNRIVNTGDPDRELSAVISEMGDELSQWPRARDGWGYVPPPDIPGAWEHTVAELKRAPRSLVEPWAGSVCSTTVVTKQLLNEIPGLRLIVDVGHLIYMDEDPFELLPYADIVQLRDCAPKQQQLHVGDGVMDFKRLERKLEALDYQGRITLEYFDLHWVGYQLDTPWEWTLDLAHYLNSL
jgi:Xylose isomerase-like TIM barrel